MTRASLRRLAYISIPTAGVAFAWYNSPTFQDIVSDVTAPVFGNTIQVPWRVRGSDGKVMQTTKRFPRLNDEQVDKKLGQHALGQTTRRPGGIAWRYHTAYLAANDGIEDAHVQSLVERDTTPLAPPGDLLFFAVMDGHAGPQTSRLLSKALIPAVAFEMSSLINSATPPSPKYTSPVSYIKSFFAPSSGKPYQFDADPVYVTAALRVAFSRLDSKIINAPINLLSHIESQKDDSTKPHQHPLAKATLEPALSGSCALLAMLDTSRRDMYVACTGDSRAVAGYWDQPKDGSPGWWRAEVLTEDQTGRNPNELKRMQSEHPAEESALVIQRGRVLGGLEPTRAFGDATYKWPREVGAKLVQNLLPPGTPTRRVSNNLKTPPYVVADPVVTHRKLSFLPSNPSSPEESKVDHDVESTLKFVVLATDGLWDQLSSKDAVALVGGHFSGVRGAAVPTSSVPVRETQGVTGIEGKSSIQRLQKDKQQDKAKQGAKWAFVDEHIGTHLIRNALGGADREKLTWMLSIPDGPARRFRDDITATVIWYENSNTLSSGAEPAEPVKAKL